MASAAKLNKALREAAPGNPDARKLGDLLRQIQTQLLNRAHAAAGLDIGSSSAAAVLIGNTVTYTIDGVVYTKATAEIAFTAGEDLADGETAKYLLSLDAAGNGTLTRGRPVTSGTAPLPKTPADQAPIGYVQVVTSGAAFDAGTTLLSAGTVTDTYVDMFVNPADVELSA